MQRREMQLPPALRLIVGGGGDDREPIPEEPGWAEDPEALLALAVALERLVGPGPDTSEGFTEEAQRWHERYTRAGQMVAEAANRDAGQIRSLISPAPEVGEVHEPGRGLLVFAKIILAPKAGER